jgi:aldehyde:ferredoxin oxidoreductase
MDCNVGGYFGPFLKFSGWDALDIVGKSDSDVIVFIDAVNNTVSIETAPKKALMRTFFAKNLQNCMQKTTKTSAISPLFVQEVLVIM